MPTRHGGKGGAIVNLSSAASRLGSPNEYVDYAASKGAIDTFTLGLSKEVAAEGGHPGECRSPRRDLHRHPRRRRRTGPGDRVKSAVPMLRGGQPEEVAKAILWLLSDEASYSTGAILDVAGGR